MSAVRMCDQCGRIFSENEDGWTTAPVQSMKRDERGQMRPVVSQRDLCPEDSGTPVNIRPRVDMGEYPNELRNEAKTRQLEREAGITPE
jgi:hypothetical protein